MPAGVCIVNHSSLIESMTEEFGPVDGRMCYEYFHDQNRAAMGFFPRPQVDNIVLFLKTLSDGYFTR